MTWWSGQALGFDFETDGPEPAEARAITCATVRLGGGAPDEQELLIQPERDIPAEATAVHGITTEHAREAGALREIAIPSIAASLAEVLGPEVPIVGHNVCYDLTVLDREMRRLGVGRLGHEQDAGQSTPMVSLWIGGQWLTSFPVIDTMVLDKQFDRYVAGSGMRKLEATARRYGVPMAEGTAHGATADVIASLRITITLANRGAFADMSLADLHCAQVRWAAEQADGLRKYSRQHPERGVDPDDVSGEWPLRGVRKDQAVETVDTTVL